MTAQVQPYMELFQEPVSGCTTAPHGVSLHPSNPAAMTAAGSLLYGDYGNGIWMYNGIHMESDYTR